MDNQESKSFVLKDYHSGLYDEKLPLKKILIGFKSAQLSKLLFIGNLTEIDIKSPSF